MRINVKIMELCSWVLIILHADMCREFMFDEVKYYKVK